jgi:hypothetical protein
MTAARAAAGGDPVGQPPERSSGQVWRLGVRVMAVQVVALILLWVIQAVFAGG